MNSSPTSYTPPNWPGFRFGDDTPWWGCYIPGILPPRPTNHVSIPRNLTAKTDQDGKHSIRIDFTGADDPPTPVDIQIEASVMDVNRQSISSSASITVHPSEYYVGFKTEKAFIYPKQKFPFEVIVTGKEFIYYL